MLKPLLFSAGIILSSLPAHAKQPNIVTDIAPVHSLVSMVTTPDIPVELLVSKNSSPHDFALKPSQAGALQNADLMFYVGAELTPWLKKPLSTLAENAKIIELLHTKGTTTLPFRESVDFGHSHDHGHEGTIDPHAWMAISNAVQWLDVISNTLAEFDPDNAQTYHQNAKAAQDKLTQKSQEIKALLTPYSDVPIVLFHDAFQYFEQQYGLNARGAFTLADGAKPSPKQVKTINELFEKNSIGCIFTEPQMNMGILNAANATNVKQATLDPLDSTIEYGADFYMQLMDKTAQVIHECLKT
jgi:zinc transport system substrate-binding protein